MHRPPSAVSLRTEPYGSSGPQWVVDQAEAELVTRYGGLDDGELGLAAAMFDPPSGAFLVVRVDGEPAPVGGVGVRTVAQGVGEVRRLWVDDPWRGHGIGRALMTGLEDEARSLGLSALILATGDRQPEAVALYESSGWERPHVDAAGARLPPGYIRFSKVIA
ncbi:MAG TPA: GNAT family N-acetyltransferase [Acidimicrobiales bacterium]|nr:GNAT family N-acetyltransferase [Acidimicrobiales bacterium]